VTGPDRCPVCNAALSFADEDREPRCHNGHVVPDALMLALERLPRATQELVKVLAGLVLVGLGKPKEEHSNGFVDARVIADETGFHIDTIGRWAEGRQDPIPPRCQWRSAPAPVRP
jgi:hypothetical protein